MKTKTLRDDMRRAVVSGCFPRLALGQGALGKLKWLLGVFTIFWLSACAAGRSPEVVERTPPTAGRFRISVAAQGEAVENPQQKLVHYIGLTSAQLERFTASDGVGLGSSRMVRVEYDARGEPAGLRVLRGGAKGDLGILGLEEDDLLTAFGKKSASSPEDFRQFCRGLLQRQRDSMTILRRGVPHKLLYFLRDRRAGAG